MGRPQKVGLLDGFLILVWGGIKLINYSAILCMMDSLIFLIRYFKRLLNYLRRSLAKQPIMWQFLQFLQGMLH